MRLHGIRSPPPNNPEVYLGIIHVTHAAKGITDGLSDVVRVGLLGQTSSAVAPSFFLLRPRRGHAEPRA